MLLNYPEFTKCIMLSCRSICLLMQAALPCFLIGSGPGTMTLRGGTNAEMAPQIDYTLMVNINLIIAFAFNKPIFIIKVSSLSFLGASEVILNFYSIYR